MNAMFHARRAVNAKDNTTRKSQLVELAARVAEWPGKTTALAGALSRQPIKYVKRGGKNVLVLASKEEQQQIVRAVARIIGR